MRWTLALLVVGVVGGCSLFVDDVGSEDCESISSRFEACDVPLDLELVLDGPHVFNTSDGTLVRPDGSEESLGGVLDVDGNTLYLVSTPIFELTSGSELRAIGEHPLVIAVQTTATIDGLIDASSKNADILAIGAGANTAPCDATAAGAGAESLAVDEGGSGGGGGGFGGAGGAGGNGNSNSTDPAPGGDGGAALDALPDQIRGGCPGGPGGPDDNDAGGDGGAGGGAIYIAAGESIDVSGVIHAGGAGGAFQPGSTGGGGGGSGGLVGLEAPRIGLGANAVLAANGGGGGSGSSSGGGVDGTGGDATADDRQAAGGSDNAPGSGDGGTGGALIDVEGGTGLSASQGAGGGGGGAGWILIFTTDLSRDDDAVMSPPSVPN